MRSFNILIAKSIKLNAVVDSTLYQVRLAEIKINSESVGSVGAAELLLITLSHARFINRNND